MADYALKKEKKKSKAPCVVCMVLYLIVALAVCTSYAARGGTAGSLKYYKAHLEFDDSRKSHHSL